MTTEPRRSIMRARAASMAPRAASPCTDGVARDAVDAASSLGGHRANVPRPPPGTPGLQRCGLGGDAHPFTPSTRHVTNSASSPSSADPGRVAQPHETASPPRAHPPASARGQTIRALPWEDATARFLQLGFEVAQWAASRRRARGSPGAASPRAAEASCLYAASAPSVTNAIDGGDGRLADGRRRTQY